MKQLTAALLAELGLSITRPGYLVSIGFSSTQRLSTFGDVSWNGNTWAGTDLRIKSLSVDMSGAQAATIELGNADLAWSALLLSEGIARRPVKIWAAYAGALAVGDVVLQVDGIGARAQINNRTATITMATPGEERSSPRKFIGAGSGFALLQPAGTRVPFNGETFFLGR